MGEQAALELYNRILIAIGERAEQIEPLRPSRRQPAGIDDRTWIIGYHPTYARRWRVTAAQYAQIIAQIAVEESAGLTSQPEPED